MADIVEFAPARELHQQRVRMSDILRRHVRATDKGLSDHDFMLEMWGRYLKSRDDYIIDPNE